MTMSALGGPPEEIGKKVAAALVGTFLGILMCYGFVGPLAANMSKLADEEHEYWHVLRVTMIAFMKGMSPLLAVEMGRRAIPAHVRPSFSGVREACKNRQAKRQQSRAERCRRSRSSRPPRTRLAVTSKTANRSSSSARVGPRRPPRRRVEGRLRRLRHRHDGAVHRAVADEHQQADSRGRRRILQRPHRHLEDGRHQPVGTGDSLPMRKTGHGEAEETNWRRRFARSATSTSSRTTSK